MGGRSLFGGIVGHVVFTWTFEGSGVGACGGPGKLGVAIGVVFFLVR